MPITTKAEAEALTVVELKTELEARGLATEGIKAVLLETLVSHMDTVETGKPEEATTEGAEEPKENDAAPVDPAAETAAPEVTEVDAPAAAEEEPEVTEVTPPAEEAVPTRALDEVSGDTEEPDAKKSKATVPATEAAEPSKAIETPSEAPASEPVAATAE